MKETYNEELISKITQNDYEIDDNCDFCVLDSVDNEIDDSDLSDDNIDKLLNKGDN